MAEASLEPPVEGGGSPKAEGNPAPPQEKPATAAKADDYVDVKVEKDRATMLVKSSAVRDSVTVTREIVAAKLAALKVVAGVDWKAVDTVIAAKQYDKTIVIAQGTMPGTSKDAWIQEKVKIDPDVKPVVAKDGHADYKNVDNIHQVKKGDVLAIKHPAVQGEPGQDIFGKATPAPAAKDVPFKLGSNTEVSADGLQLVASTGGYVFHQAGAICVGITYTLKGDVDFKTGNLHYQGDIIIMGNVTDGFTVEAEGDVTVEGNVDAATIISKTGSVRLKAAAFGHGKGSVKARKSIHLQSAQDLALECEGEVVVDKGLRNCKVTATIIRADKAGCSVVGGNLKAYSEISVAVLGGEGCHTELKVVDKEAEAARERLKEIEKQRLHAVPKVEAMEKKLKGMKALAERFKGDLSPRARGELKAALEQYAAVKKELDGHEQEKAKLAHAVNSAARHTGKCSITEKMVWGGLLDLYGHLRDLEADDAKKEWVWSMDGLLSRSVMPEAKPGNPPGPATPPSAPPS